MLTLFPNPDFLIPLKTRVGEGMGQSGSRVLTDWPVALGGWSCGLRPWCGDLRSV